MFPTLILTFTLYVSAFALPTAKPNDRIHGGSPASPGQFPYIASLRTRNSHFCGASIISNYWLVSAAHCVVGNSAQSITIVVGATSLSSGGTPYQAYSATAHPYYNSDSMLYDISLIRSSQPFQFSSYVSSIYLNTAEIQEGARLTLAGWGVTEYGDLSESLLWIDLQSLSYENCRQMSPLPVYESNVCTIASAGRGACNGDSGGPLTANGALVGVVSWGIPCALGYPDVFTKVASYVQWIQANAT